MKTVVSIKPDLGASDEIVEMCIRDRLWMQQRTKKIRQKSEPST